MHFFSDKEREVLLAKCNKKYTECPPMHHKITLVNSRFVYIGGEVGSNAVYYNVQIEKQKSLSVLTSAASSASQETQ